MPRPRATGGFARRLLLVELVAGIAAGAYSLRVAAAYERPLGRLHGAGFTCVVAALALGGLFGLIACWRILRARPALRLAPVLRGTLVVAVLAYASFLVFAQPYHSLHLKLSLGLAGGLGCAVALAVLLAGGAVPAEWWRRLDFLAFQLCAVALGLELSLRAFAAVRPVPILGRGDTRAEDVLAAYRVPPGTLHVSYPANSRGFYDEELRPRRPGERLVVSIGDSFSFGAAHYLWHYTTVCERALGDALVDNVGAPGIGALEYLYLLQKEVGYLQPDAVVIALFVGNDLDPLNLRRAPRRFDLRLWFDRENVLLYLVPRRLMLMRREREARDVEPAHATGALLDRAEALAAMPWLEAPLEEPALQSVETFLRIEISRAQVMCTEDGVDYSLVRAVFQDFLRAAGDIPLYVMIIPEEFQVEDTVWETVVGHLPGVALDRDRPQRRLSEVFEELGIEYLDLLPILRATEPLADGRKHVYYVQDTHFNARGNRIAGEALAAFLAERLGAR